MVLVGRVLEKRHLRVVKVKNIAPIVALLSQCPVIDQDGTLGQIVMLGDEPEDVLKVVVVQLDVLWVSVRKVSDQLAFNVQDEHRARVE